jgi:hypothetical protein
MVIAATLSAMSGQTTAPRRARMGVWADLPVADRVRGD